MPSRRFSLRDTTPSNKSLCVRALPSRALLNLGLVAGGRCEPAASDLKRMLQHGSSGQLFIFAHPVDANGFRMGKTCQAESVKHEVPPHAVNVCPLCLFCHPCLLAPFGPCFWDFSRCVIRYETKKSRNWAPNLLTTCWRCGADRRLACQTIPQPNQHDSNRTRDPVRLLPLVRPAFVAFGECLKVAPTRFR